MTTTAIVVEAVEAILDSGSSDAGSGTDSPADFSGGGGDFGGGGASGDF